MMISEFADQPATVAELIGMAQADLALSDEHIAEALGYEGAVIAELLKQGKMRLPICKVPDLATLLQIEPAKLMQMALHEVAPEMLAAIEFCYGPLVLSDAEVRLIQSVRQSAGGRAPALITFDKESMVALVVATSGA